MSEAEKKRLQDELIKEAENAAESIEKYLKAHASYHNDKPELSIRLIMQLHEDEEKALKNAKDTKAAIAKFLEEQRKRRS